MLNRIGNAFGLKRPVAFSTCLIPAKNLVHSHALRGVGDAATPRRSKVVSAPLRVSPTRIEKAVMVNVDMGLSMRPVPVSGKHHAVRERQLAP